MISFKNINIFLFPERKSGFGGKFGKATLTLLQQQSVIQESVPVILCFIKLLAPENS